jgi:hypothetical protein
MDIPAAQQDELFRRLPIEFAANWSRFFLIATCMFCCTRVRAKTGLPSQTTSSRPRGAGFQRSPDDGWRLLMNGPAAGAWADGKSAESAKPMLQRILADRFKLVVKFVVPQPRRAAENLHRIDTISFANQIQHGCKPDFIPAAANNWPSRIRVTGRRTGMNVRDFECRFSFGRLAESYTRQNGNTA